MSAKKKRPITSGPPTPHAERQEKGQLRIDVYLPPEAAEDFRLVVERVAQELGLPPVRAKTQAVVRAIRELAAKFRRKK